MNIFDDKSTHNVVLQITLTPIRPQIGYSIMLHNVGRHLDVCGHFYNSIIAHHQLTPNSQMVYISKIRQSHFYFVLH
jgi:hypothetical protein